MKNVMIRPYQEEDFDVIHSWWVSWGEVPPIPGMMIPDGTFVLEWNDKPVMTLTALKTQSKEIAYFEGYCRSPEVDKSVSNQLGQLLWEHASLYLKYQGFKRVIILTDKVPLRNRYMELGMDWKLSNIHSLGKVL